jgi:hypothetical protein
MVMKIFPSLGQARKNGFDQPLTLGTHFRKLDTPLMFSTELSGPAGTEVPVCL